MSDFRIEQDSMGEVQVPADALYGAQTQRAIDNFNMSDLKLPFAFIRAIALIKYCAAETNAKLGLLPKHKSDAIMQAALEVFEGQWQQQFPVDVFQTGSGTSTNMNVNEVLAHLAMKNTDAQIHPNDHVNLGQSSNDVIPTAIQLSASRRITRKLIPALERLIQTLEDKASEHNDTIKTGRTHLMDAMPITFAQELRAWKDQVILAKERFEAILPQLRALPQGGTAVGTGINTHPDFSQLFVQSMSDFTEHPYTVAKNPFANISGQDIAVAVAGITSSLATVFMKMANDLRWMNSGPLAGFQEALLPALQPGSSIMPGKVNPVEAEAVCMACAQVFGNQASINVAGQSGNFQLNVMLPLIAYNLLQSIGLMIQSADTLAEKCIKPLQVNIQKMAETVALNPILVTALNPIIGYQEAAKIAKKAYAEGRPVVDVAAEMTNIPKNELERLLDPKHLTKPQIER